MRRNLIHLLLSVALIFQGMGVVCAYGPMSDFMVMQGAMVGNMASAMAADSNPCSSGHIAGQDCMQSCAMPAELPRMVLVVEPLFLSDALALPPTVSLVDYVQVPPTPPPIA